MPKLVAIITAAFAAGIWCAGYFTWLLPIMYVSCIVLAIIAIWRIYRNEQVIWIIGALFLVIGMVRFIHDDAIGPNDISRYAGQKMSVYGTIVEIPQVIHVDEEKSKVRYVIAVREAQRENAKKITVTGMLAVSARQSKNSQIVRLGDEIRVTGEIVSLHGYNNPGQYDSVAAAKRQGIRARMSAYGEEISIVSKNSNVSWKNTLAIWREKIIENMQKVMPQSHAAILVGMLFGGYSGIPHEVVTSFASTGIVHILSVSGSHIAMVVGVITALGKVVARRFVLAETFIPILSAVVVIFYAIFCGLTPPVMRSLIMGLIGLAAICLEREKDAAVALFISALGMLIHQPTLIYDLSFQLSFASTAGLVFLNAKTLKMLNSFPQWISHPLAVTISAQLGVLPFIAWYFNSISLSSLVANIMIVPVIEWIVVIGLFGAVIGMVFGVVGNILMVICSLLIGVVLPLNSWLAAVPGAKLYAPAIGIIGGFSYYVLLAWIYGYKPQNMLSLTELVKKWPRHSAVVVVGMVFCIIIYIGYPRPVYIHFIDVGQGDATLIITPHGRAVLVDAGGTIGETDFDVGERVVVPYLKHYGVLDIDYLFLTHGHQDHAGGAAAVARDLLVKNIMLPRENYTQAVRNLLHVAHGSSIIGVYDGQRIEIDGVAVSVVHAVSGVNSRQANEASSVIQVSYGRHSFLITGDLEAQGEETILSSNARITSNVLKVGHHGSKTSSTSGFLQAVAPEYAVISVGKNNHFGHPSGEVLERLLVQNSKVYRTDQHGAIVFETDGNTLVVDTFIK